MRNEWSKIESTSAWQVRRISNKNGIDFIIRKDATNYFDIQVKSAMRSNYVFMPKKLFEPRDNLLLALVLFEENEEPSFFLIPSMEWKRRKYSFLADYDYKGKNSKPERGISITRSSREALNAKFSFDKQMANLPSNQPLF